MKTLCTAWAWFWVSIAALFALPFMACLWIGMIGKEHRIEGALNYFLGAEYDA